MLLSKILVKIVLTDRNCAAGFGSIEPSAYQRRKNFAIFLARSQNRGLSPLLKLIIA